MGAQTPRSIPLAGNPDFTQRMAQQQQEAAKVSNTDKGVPSITAPNTDDYFDSDKYNKTQNIFQQNVGRPASERELSDLLASSGNIENFTTRAQALGAQERQQKAASRRSPFVGRSSLFGR